jgi:hypothetical protein
MIIKKNSVPLLSYLRAGKGSSCFEQPAFREIFLKVGSVILLVAVLLISTTSIAIAMAPQLWYLDSETTTPGYQMEKNGGPGDDGQAGSVDIGPANSALWLADQAALVDVTFPSGSWVVEIRTDSDWGTEGDKCLVTVGGWDTDTGWYEIPTISVATITWDSGFNILTVLLQTDSGTVYIDDYLALSITNQDSCSHVVHTDGRSSLRSPDTDPGYPVPELATGILLGLGLFGLIGYLKLRKRNGIAINA